MEISEQLTAFYTIETLTILNRNKSKILPFNQNDVDKVNQFIESLNNQLEIKEPKDGDRIILHGKNRDGLKTYCRGHIQDRQQLNTTKNQLYVCTQPFTPYINISDNGHHYTNASGGYWLYIDKSKVEFTGKVEKKEFWNFIKDAGADMGVYFSAFVKVFEYTDMENIY